MCLCAFISLSSERAATSPSESAVVVTSVVECLRYCIVHHKEEEEDQERIRTMLISQQVGSHRHTYLSIHVKSTKVLACLTLFCLFSSSYHSLRRLWEILPFRMVLFSFWSLKCLFPGRIRLVYILVKPVTARMSFKCFWQISGKDLAFCLCVMQTTRKQIHRLWKG